MAFLFISCGGGGSDAATPTPEPANTAPSVPSLVAPTNSLLCINNVVTFEIRKNSDSSLVVNGTLTFLENDGLSESYIEIDFIISQVI